MRFRHVSGNPLSTKSDFLIVCVDDSPGDNATFKALNTALNGELARRAKRESFGGKEEQILISGGTRDVVEVLFAGLGAKGTFSLGDVRDAAAIGVRTAATRGASSVTFVLPTVEPNDVHRGIQFAVEGARLGAYRFVKYKAKEPFEKDVKRFAVVTSSGKPTVAAAKLFSSAVTRGAVVADAVCLARDFVNEPADYMTPTQMAAEARAIGRTSPALKVRVYSAKEIEELRMGMFLAVGRGAAQESKLIHMTYAPSTKPSKRVVLIGKGVMFDSGGYSLKPSASMEDMKTDMAGSAAVIASMGAIARLGSSCEVHAVAACCENLVSGSAYKLGDVLTALDGTTVEINNTDAEGRLTLGDAIGFAREKIKPDEMFDFATLTGACMVALGNFTAGVMSDHAPLVTDWLEAANQAKEDMWRLPLDRNLKPQLKSNIADMKNTGERWGGALTAGLFLKHFAKDTPWVHVDLAGPASAARPKGAIARGGTGFGVGTIVEYLTRK